MSTISRRRTSSKIAKRFVSELLEAPAGLKREAVERMPGFGVELDAASDGPGHGLLVFLDPHFKLFGIGALQKLRQLGR